MFARRLTGDSDQAYEATQQSFISAWKAIERYDGRPFDTWLRAIALNKVRDLGRRAAVRRLIRGEERKVAAFVDPASSAEQQMMDRERMDALGRAVAGLPETLKGALVLTAMEGCSHAEAASILGVSAKAVETRVSRAKKQLIASIHDGEKPRRH